MLRANLEGATQHTELSCSMPRSQAPHHCSAGDRLLGDKVRELTEAQAAAQVPEVLLQALLAHLAASPAKFSSQYAALRAADPRLKPRDAGPEGGHQPDSTSAVPHGRQPSIEDSTAMADSAKPRGLASLMEELGCEVTSSVSAVQGLMAKVRKAQLTSVPMYVFLGRGISTGLRLYVSQRRVVP